MKVLTNNLKKLSILNFIILLMHVPMMLVIAKLMASIFKLATNKNVSLVINKSILTLAILLIYTLVRFLLGILYEKKRLLYLHEFKLNIYKQFLSNSLNNLYTAKNGEVIEKLNDDFTNVTSKVLTLRPQLYINIITILGYSAYLYLLNPLITGILLAISLIQIIPPLIVKKFMEVNYQQTRHIEAKITNYIIEGYNGFQIIKLYGLKTWFLCGANNLFSNYLKIGTRTELTHAANISMYKVLENILKYGTYAVLGILVLRGYSSIDVVVQAIALSASLYAAVKSLFESIPKFSIAKIAESRLGSWFDNKSTENRSLTSTKIILNTVQYAVEEKTIYHNLSACIDGDKILLVKGGNGAGKSTLLRLIMGLVRTKQGYVSIGGIAPNDINEKDYIKKIMYLPQEDFMLPVTAKELIQMCMQSKSNTTIDHAADFGLSQKKLSSTQMIDLSGGERKKVLLSIALTYENATLLLDEPTNSLDENSKQLLKAKLSSRKGGAIIVTHDTTYNDIASNTLTVSAGGVDFD